VGFSGYVVKVNTIAEGFDPPGESANDLGTIAAVEIVGTEICGFRKVWHLISGYSGPFAEGTPV
jgi:hypothetical protein